jgi:hypothetical protein
MKHGSGGSGFTAHPPTLESHASRTDQRADDVDSHAQGIGSASLHGQSLGNVGTGTSSAVNNTVQRASTAVSGMGSKLRNTATTTRSVAGRYRDTEDGNAGLFNPSKFESGPARGLKTSPQSAGTSASGSGTPSGGGLMLNGGKPTNLGTHDDPFNVTTQLTDHQMKHQVGPINGLKPYTGGKGEKFSGNVNGDWHEKYFGPNAANMAKAEYDKASGPLKQHQADAARLADERDELQRLGKNKNDDMLNASGDQKQQLKTERDDLARQYAAKKQEAADAQGRADAEDARLKNTTFNIPKDADQYNVKYDGSMSYDHNSQSWNVSYHNNPNTTSAESRADGNNPGKTWWNDNGKRIAKDNPTLGLNTP